MFTAILSTFITSLSQVFWKKSLQYNIRPLANNLAVYSIPFILLGYFFFTSEPFHTSDLIAVLLVGWILFMDILRAPLQQKLMTTEKISVLMPYTNLNKIFIIISSFFLFHDVSFISLLIILFTVFIIMLASFDFQSKRLPKNFWLILIIEILTAIAALLSWWVVIKYTDTLLFSLYTILGFLVFLLLTLRSWQIQDLKTAPYPYWKYRYIWWLGWVSWFLSLVVIKTLWLSISILLWFVGIGITLIISYIFLNDTPSKKDILLTIVVAGLIGIWYYFK